MGIVILLLIGLAFLVFGGPAAAVGFVAILAIGLLIGAVLKGIGGLIGAGMKPRRDAQAIEEEAQRQAAIERRKRQLLGR